jgi:aryl-alcohol dehydrogenase-like predicted oxidoreductase
MQYRPLGASGLEVSELCLGTMTFGQQNTEAEAHIQLDYAIANGINFIDTAEMYPVPAQADTYGATESFVGTWLKHQPRDRLIIATKIAGPSRGLEWIRGGPALTPSQIGQALDDSLRRLQTDYIDLYQIHWPDRYVPLFGQATFNPKQDREMIPIVEQLAAFAKLFEAGKIRYLGLSNETPWGICQFCTAAQQLNLPRIVSVQNAYNLLNRVADPAVVEACYREQLGFLAYSPLGFGNLSGKYLTSAHPQTRMSLFPNFGGRYRKPQVDAAVAAYVDLARYHRLSPAAMAIAFLRSRWFVTSTIIGATTLEQLQENMSSLRIDLSRDFLAELDAIHTRHPNPAP